MVTIGGRTSVVLRTPVHSPLSNINILGIYFFSTHIVSKFVNFPENRFELFFSARDDENFLSQFLRERAAG